MTDDTPQEERATPPQDLGRGPSCSPDEASESALNALQDSGSVVSSDSSHDLPERGLSRRYSQIDRGLGDRFSIRVPAKHDAAHTAAETHGINHWKVKILHFLHSDVVQGVFMALLLADVIILFVELFLQASYPNCRIIERDAISCCSPDLWEAASANNSTTTTVDEHMRRFLAGDDEGHGDNNDSHHNLCEDGGVEGAYDATCDTHKWENIHTLEIVLFGLTVTILSLFLLELVTMAIILQKAFFRQIFYVLDFFIVATSLALELTFHFVHEDILVSIAGLLVFFRVWRFVRIGHGLVEVTAEYAHKDKEALIDYAEALELMLQKNQIDLPEMSRRVKHIKKKVEEDRSHHSLKKKKKKQQETK